MERRAEMAMEIDRCTRESVLPQLQKVSESLAPLTHWTGDIRHSVEPYLESARAFSALAARVRPTVLVVDDDGLQLKITARILESEDYAVKCVASGMEAMRFLAGASAELILMDLQMPDMDGLEVTGCLKSDPRLARIPVIMITGNSQREIVLKSREFGIVDFIAKPFDRNALLAKVARALATRQAA
jgi:CheY-like chemotaxis protein